MMACPNQWAVFAPQNLYAIDIDKENRNCYNCGRFGYLARNCRNKRMGGRIREDRRLEYRKNEQRTENNRSNNLNRDKNLIVLN